MMWADNHAKRRYLDATCLSIATYVSFSRMMDISFLYVYIIYRTRARDRSRALVALLRSSQLPSRSKLSISIGYNDALVYNYWILWRTAGYIAAPDLKGKKKRARSCMKVATAMSGKERSAALSRPLYRRTIDSRTIAIYVELLRQLFFCKLIGSIASYRFVCHIYV